LIESLRDPGEAEDYLNAALEEDEPELFLLALRNG
jgi:DNA-binding phage protein